MSTSNTKAYRCRQISLDKSREISKSLDLSSFDISTFSSETDILRLILYRNKNQHQISKWWPHAANLLRRCEQLVDAFNEQLELESPEAIKRIKDKIGRKKVERKAERKKGTETGVSKRELKRRKRDAKRTELFAKMEEQEKDEPLSLNHDTPDTYDGHEIRYIPPGTQKRYTKILNLATFITIKLAPGCYRAFHGIINLGFFITLGFALMGLLARLWKLLEPIVQQGIGARQIHKLHEKRLAMEKNLISESIEHETKIDKSILDGDGSDIYAMIEMEGEKEVGMKVSREEAKKYFQQQQENQQTKEEDVRLEEWEIKINDDDDNEDEDERKSNKTEKVTDVDEPDLRPDDLPKKKRKRRDDIDDIFNVRPSLSTKKKDADEALDSPTDPPLKKKKKSKKNKVDLDAIFNSAKASTIAENSSPKEEGELKQAKKKKSLDLSSEKKKKKKKSKSNIDDIFGSF